MTNVLIQGNITLTEQFSFVHEDDNVVVVGKLHSNSDITLKVKNLIVIGEITSTQNITINTKQDFFNNGLIEGANGFINSENNIYNGLGDLAIEKIRALGIDLSRNPNGGFTVSVPQ